MFLEYSPILMNIFQTFSADAHGSQLSTCWHIYMHMQILRIEESILLECLTTCQQQSSQYLKYAVTENRPKQITDLHICIVDYRKSWPGLHKPVKVITGWTRLNGFRRLHFVGADRWSLKVAVRIGGSFFCASFSVHKLLLVYIRALHKYCLLWIRILHKYCSLRIQCPAEEESENINPAEPKVTIFFSTHWRKLNLSTILYRSWYSSEHRTRLQIANSMPSDYLRQNLHSS